MSKYPHMRTDGDFPNVAGVNVYQYDNQLDYGRYDYTQMQICVCRVPWDMGEAHVGQRTISGIGNVVYFEDTTARDAWFDAIPDSDCFRWETKYKELHRDFKLNVPLPFDIAARYNYVYVRYNLFANDDSTLEYEGTTGVRKWFYFIREVNFIAPNTTELVLMDDAWQTWIYDVDITGMVLERGHAPMFAKSADDYLANPLQNNDGLLTEDVNYGELQQVANTDTVTFNADDMYACIALTCNPRMEWGEWLGDWNDDTFEDTTARMATAGKRQTLSGVPAFQLLALPASDVNSFFDDVYDNIPQFKQAIQGVFFVASELLAFDDESFTLVGHTCYTVARSVNVSKQLSTISKDKFGFASEYADIAKLYTYPYSAIELCNENGTTQIIRIEDTTGTLGVTLGASLVFPYINLTANITGIGGTQTKTLKYSNISERSFGFSGRWYQYVKQWDIPCFAVYVGSATVSRYEHHYDRVQARLEYENTKTNADARAKANQDVANNRASINQSNAKGIASANKTIADNTADNIVDNAEAQQTANTTINSNSNMAATTDKDYVNGLATALQAWEAGYTRDSTNNEVDAANASASIAATSAVAQSASSGVISGLSSMNPISAVADIVGGIVSGGISGASTLASNAVAVNLKSTQAETLVSFTQQKLTETTGNNDDRTTNQVDVNTKNKNATNALIATTAANSSATAKENATTQKNRMDSNANATYTMETGNASTIYTMETGINTRDRTTAIKAVQNGYKQDRLKPATVYGSFMNDDTATTRPMALFANIVTESDSAIANAGDEFLRYGYMYDRQWAFDGNWNIGAHFTYWKLKDFWVRGLQVPDLYMDKLRFFLFGGVTVWRKPEDIGNITIYENGVSQ